MFYSVLGTNLVTFLEEGSNWREVDVLYVIVFIVSLLRRHENE